MHDVFGIASAVRGREATATEIVTEHLDAIDSSPLNAFTSVDRTGALAAAGRIDDAVERGEDPGAMAGVPIGVKDLIDQQGLLNTAGSSFYRVVPDHTAPALRRLEAAGAVPVGRTGLHEFAFGFSSENHWFGPVRNPWNLETSPGGSSGGSAAAVAAGLVPAALGTDTGGSVRVPAALCGVVGLKVTHGRIPISGVFPLAPSLDTVGPLTRSVAETALLYSLMAGGSDDDPWSSFAAVVAPGEPADPTALRIGIPASWVEKAPMSGEIRTAFAGFCDALSKAGARVDSADLPEALPSDLLTASVYGEVAAVHRRFRDIPGNAYGPGVDERMRKADAVTLDQYIAGLEWRARLRQSATRVFSEFDLLITPATGTTTKRIGHTPVETETGTVHYRAALSWFSAPINHTGLPALVVPIRTEGSPPPAVQIVAPWWHEHRLLEFGAYLEANGLSEVKLPPNAE